jgi:hypothetical protein
MSKFKDGDVVVRVDGEFFGSGCHEAIVSYESYAENYVLQGEDGVFSGWFLEAHELEAQPTYPNPPQKHREVIIAWANGADIEYKHSAFANWDRAATPVWSSHVKYRVKPTKTPQELKLEQLEKQAKELQKTIQELKESNV